MRDESDRLVAGDLPVDPEADAAPFETESRKAARLTLEGLSVAAAGASLTNRRLCADRSFFAWPGGHTGAPTTATQLPAGALYQEPRNSQPDWPHLARMAGPLSPDRLIVVVGHTNRGKSAWALQVAHSAATRRAPVLYMSCEMGTAELAARLVALHAIGDQDKYKHGVPHRAVKNGGANKEELAEALQSLQEQAPALYLWAPGPKARTPEALREISTLVWKQHGKAPLIVVDYLQRLADGPDRRTAVLELSGCLRDLARDDGGGDMPEGWPGACVVALSTAARPNYKALDSVENLRKASRGEFENVTLEGMAKESGEVEADADLVLVLTSNKGEGMAPREALIAVAKVRGGGNQGTVRMRFVPACGRWEEEGIQGFHAEALNKGAPT